MTTAVASVDNRPPLDLASELVYPDGSTVRWDKDAPLAKDQPTGMSFGTARYNGFTEGQVVLNRRIDIDYPDLQLLDGINFIAGDGSVAYEGAVGSMPRSLQTKPEVTVQAQGFINHAKDHKFVEVYADRDLSKWKAPSAARTAQLLTAGYSSSAFTLLTDESGEPCIELGFLGSWANKPASEAWWGPYPGISIGALYYNFSAFNSVVMPTGEPFALTAVLDSVDRETTTDTSGNLWPTLKAAYLAATATRLAASLSMSFPNPGGSANFQYMTRMSKLAVYGNHRLERHGEDPGGFYISDMMIDIAHRFAPLLDTSGVQPNNYIVSQASFLDETFPYDAWLALNAYSRWELNVYEGRRLNYYPMDLSDWDWEIRLSDPGVTSQLQGDDVSALCNGVIVRYTSLETGLETRITPEEASELTDPSPDNPANRASRKIWPTLNLSIPVKREDAVQMGRAYLAEFNQAKSPGTINVVGHVRDRAGHWQPAWKVRAGDRISITDLPNESVRVVGETKWDHDTKTLSIAVDSSFKAVDAIMARLALAVEASNVSLPSVS